MSIRLDGSEKLGIEYKIIPIICSLLDEEILKNSIRERKYDTVVDGICVNFIEYIKNILPKYFSQALNTEELIDSDFKIYFGVSDDGNVIGFPVKDVNNMTNMIQNVILKTFSHIIESSIIKDKDLDLTDDIMYINESHEMSYTKSYTKSSITDNEVEIKEIMSKIDLIDIEIDFIPINAIESYLPKLEHKLIDIVNEYETRISLYEKYKYDKSLIYQEWLHRSSYIKTSISNILNTERRYEFLLWLKYEAPKSVSDLDNRFGNLDLVFSKLEKKTNNNYDYIDLEYQCLQNPTEHKTLEYNILKLTTMYRDIIVEQLNEDTKKYKLAPVIPPPNEPYTSICSCYIGSVMKDISDSFPLYVCSIKISNIRAFLNNIKLEHFYYENESGMFICQIRKIATVSKMILGPVSADKL